MSVDNAMIWFLCTVVLFCLLMVIGVYEAVRATAPKRHAVKVHAHHLHLPHLRH